MAFLCGRTTVLHSMPGVRAAFMPNVIGPARVSTIVGPLGAWRHQNVMHSNYYALKTWAALAATLLPLLAVFGGSETESPTNSQEWRGPVSSRLDSVKTKTNGPAKLVTGGLGRLGLVVSAAPEGAVVERVVIGGPAWQAGVRSGDVIVAADAMPLGGVASPRIAQILRGPVDSEVEMTLRRPGQRELLKVKPKRALFSPPKDIIGL